MAEAGRLEEFGNIPHSQCATAMNGEKSIIKGNNSLLLSQRADAGSLRVFVAIKS